MKVCSLLEVTFVTRWSRLSDLYIAALTDLTLELKFRIFFFMMSTADHHTDLRIIEPYLAVSIRTRFCYPHPFGL